MDEVQSLLDLDGIDIHYFDKDGCTSLWMASQEGHIDIVKVLLKAGGNVNQAQTTDGCTPLYIASHNGHLATVKVLIKAGGNANQHSHKNQTPLNIACYFGKINIVRLLLQQPNIDTNKINDWNLTPCANAEAQGHHEIVTLFE